MVLEPVHCPNCGSINVVRHGKTAQRKQRDNGRHIASVTVRRIGTLELFNRFDRVSFRLSNTDKTIVLTKEFFGGELDDPTKITDRRNVFIRWNGKPVKISDAWDRSVVWNVQED